MKVVIREINYREVDVPIDTTIFDIEDMIRNGEVVVGDTLDSEYSVKFPESEDYEYVCQED